MIALEISINGTVVCTVGNADMGILSATIARVKRFVGRHERSHHRRPVEDYTRLSVSAVRPSGEAATEEARWTQADLSVGDSVTIRVVDVDIVDTPHSSDNSGPPLDFFKRFYE